jgi:CubicO group peptidase (beta-lactamase class C family)
MKGVPVPHDRRVTIDNYMAMPDTFRWSNLNSEIVFPTLEVSRGHSAVRPLPRRMIDSDRFNRTTVSWGNGGLVSVLHWLANSHTDGFIALHDGHIVSEQYFGEMRPRTRHRLYSIVKPFLAVAGANELSAGTIDDHKVITEYVDELSHTGYRGATVRQVLDMQAGIEFRYWSKGIGMDDAAWKVGTPEFRQADHEMARFFRVCGFVRKLDHEVNTSIYDLILSPTKQVFAHGTVINYACPTTGVFQLILERSTNDTRAIEHLERNVWSKLGVEHNALLQHDGLGTTTPGGGLSVTLRDLARWGQLFIDKGRAGSTQVIPADFVDDLIRNPQREKGNEKSNLWGNHLHPGGGYRSYMFLPPVDPLGNVTFIAGGGYGQHCYIDPARRNVIVKLSSEIDFDVSVHRDLAAIRSLSEHLPDMVS